MHQVSTKENKNTKIKPKQSMHVESQIQQSKRVALDVHTNQQRNAHKSSWKWEWNSVKMSDKKLTVALLGMLPHNQELHGFHLYFLFYESTRSPLIFSLPLISWIAPSWLLLLLPQASSTVSHYFAPSYNSCTQSPSTPPFRKMSPS